MYIALVTETFPPEVNGVARTLERLVRGLYRRGYEVEIVRPRPAEEATDGPWHEVWVPAVQIPVYKELRMGLASVGRLVRRWREDRPDLVHVATEGPLGLAALRAARRLGIPVTSSFHTNFHIYAEHYGFGVLHRALLAYLRAFHNRTLTTMVPAPDIQASLAQSGFQRLSRLARGVDTNLFTPRRRDDGLRAQWGLGPDDVAMAVVGRVAPEKNIDLAIRASQRVREQVPSARLVVVGDGPAAPVLRRRHPDVIFAGTRRGVDLAAHYASADMLMFPSQTDTFGNVVLEAMASGIPVVSYACAAAGLHIRSGQNGMTARCYDSDDFIDAATKVACLGDRRRAMGAAARKTAAALDWENIVDVFSDTLVAQLEGARGMASLPERERRWSRPALLPGSVHAD